MADDSNTKIGGAEFKNIENSNLTIEHVDASVTARGHIAGRDVVIYNYYYAQAEVSPALPAETTDSDEPIPANPYRSLFAFRPEHAPFFFGREKFTGELVAAVESRRLVTVLGASGSGKSSVVFAGLVPALAQRPGELWLFSTFRPGDDPFQNLAAALVPLYETLESKTALLGATRDLAASLRQGRYPLGDVLGLIQEARPDHRLLLIADQFEELYTLCRDPDERQAFLDGLLGVIRAEHLPLPIHLVLTLRADFLGQASLYRPLADALQGTLEILGPMTETELRDAIEKPAGLQGVSFEAGLVKTLLADVGRQAGSLPLLEFALSELWQGQERRTLTHRAYLEIGQVEGALSRHADRAYAHLKPEEQAQARRVFVQLVNPGSGTEDTRRLATRKELDRNWDLVARLADERLVVTGRQPASREDEKPEDTVEVVHEALIRHWPQLRRWLEADRAFLTWQLGLRADLARWEAAKGDEGALLRGAPLAVAQEQLQARPDDLNPAERDFIEASLARQKKQERQRRLLLAGAMAAAVVMAVLAGVSILQWREANQQRAALADQNAKAQAELNFYQATDPAIRLAELYTLFSRGDADSRARARSLFFGLREVEQLALLGVSDKPEELAEVSRAILPNLADINGIYYTNAHLAALQESLADPDLQARIEGWLAAREAAQAGDDDQAITLYTGLLETDGQNPALWFERGRLWAKQGRVAEALADFSEVMDLAGAPEYGRSGVLPVGPEFATTEQMAKAVAWMILVYPELAAEVEANKDDYPDLLEVRLPTLITDAKGVEMVQVPAGAFNMGSSAQGATSDEQPVHRVYLDEFYIDRYEVTNERFISFLNERGNQEEGGVRWLGAEEDFSRISAGGDGWQIEAGYADHPVTGVSWYGARAYCNWRGGRLPTEAEWEKAARGDEERTYPWGEGSANHLLNYYGNVGGTTPVENYPEGLSPYGVYNMAGNVYEWVADWYDNDYYKQSLARNPSGPEDGVSKVLRGGSWPSLESFARAPSRSFNYPDAQYDNLGFRCVAASAPE